MDPFTIMLLMGAVGSMAGGASSIFGGQAAAATAKAQAAGQEIDRQWQDFNKQWETNKQNFVQVQQYAAQKTARKGMEKTSLSNQLAEQREILRQTSIEQSVVSNRYLQVLGTVMGTSQSRGGDPSRGSNALITNQVTNNVMKDMAAVNRNSAIAIKNSAARRTAMLDGQAPIVRGTANVFMPSTPISQPDVSGILLSSFLSGVGQIAGGAGQMYGALGSK